MQNLSLPPTKGEGGPVGLDRPPTETDVAHAQQGGWAGGCVTKAVMQIIRG
jgi:hypothetical protein